MHRYKFLRYLSILTFAEKKEFEKQLAASKQKGDLRLFRKAVKFISKPKTALAIKPILFRQIFPNQPYNDARLRKMMTRLTQALKEYLGEKEFCENQPIKKKLLIKSLAEREDYGLFLEIAEGRLKELDKNKKRGLPYFREKYQIWQAIYFHPETIKFTTKNNCFQQMLYYQERHHILDTLMSGAESLSRKRTIKSNETIDLLHPILKRVDNMEGDCPGIILLFKKLVTLLKPNKVKPDLDKLKNQLLATFDLMEQHEQRMALKLLILYATPFSNRGKKEYTQFIFGIYKLGIDHHLLRHGKTSIGAILFINIAFTGITLEELNWAKNFIKKYIPEIPIEDQEHALNLCNAGWHYKRGIIENSTEEMKEALSLLSRIPTRSSEKFDLRTRSLYLRILFDLFQNDERELGDVLENAKNFERHLKNNKTYSSEKKEAYLAFVGHCRRLAKLHGAKINNIKALKIYTANLQKDQTCILKHWLLEKAGELTSSPAQ